MVSSCYGENTDREQNGYVVLQGSHSNGAIIGISFFPLGIMVVEMWEYLFDHCSIICDHDHDPVYCSM